MGVKAWVADIPLEYSMFHFALVHWRARILISDRLSNNFRAAGASGHLDFSFLLTFCDPCGRSRQSRLVGYGECRSSTAKLSCTVFRWSGAQAFSDNVQNVIWHTVYETSLSAMTPDWCAVLCGLVN